MAYDSKRQRVVLFGGDGVQANDLSAVWEWDGATWMRIAAGTGPGARSRHRMAYDSMHGVIVLYGGQVGTGTGARYPQDTWACDGVKWEQKATQGPPPRYVHAMAYDTRRQRLVMSGGGRGGPPYNLLRDLWECDGAQWVQR